jgi:aspartate racemase
VLAILVGELQRLHRAGAGCAIVAANSPHVVFDELQRRSPLPLVSIVEATALEAIRLRRKRLGLFGTRVTMQGMFYQEVFGRSGMTLVVPDEAEQAFIHDKYMTELLKGLLRPETRERLLEGLRFDAQRLQLADGVLERDCGGTHGRSALERGAA